MTLDGSFEAQLEAEALAETRDCVAGLEVMMGNLRSGAVAAADAGPRLRGEAERMALAGRGLERPLLALAVSRLGAYVRDLERPGPRALDDLDAFTEVLRGLVDGDIAEDADPAEFYRSLPARRPADLEDFAHLDVEILLVEPHRASARFFERELVNSGYRVSAVQNSFQALELAVRTRPDLVVSSAVLDQMSGIDLACALAAMPVTDGIPFALLTSYGRDDPALARLPAKAAVLRKGPEFGEDLAEALGRFGIL